MPYGLVTPEMKTTLAPFVRGQDVWDLGAGDMTYSEMLLKLGADHVWAVDKCEPLCEPVPPRVTYMEIYFALLCEVKPPPKMDVVLLSWPCNCWGATPGLPELVRRAETVLYLGHNLDGTCCGTEPLWDDLTQREILAHIPHERNSLIVYGEHVGRRMLVPEEIGATCGQVVSYKAAVEIANRLSGLLPYNSSSSSSSSSQSQSDS